MGVTTVAEGVETQVQLDRVAAEGCREVQGFLFGRPAPSEADKPMIEVLNQRTSAPVPVPTPAATRQAARAVSVA